MGLSSRSPSRSDKLFVYSSQIRIPGSDVDVLLERVFPALPPRVLVHFNDIFQPGGYPASWAHRHCSEQEVVAALLQEGR